MYNIRIRLKFFSVFFGYGKGGIEMRRVTNCILIDQDQVLLIKKPRRGWYSIPGGKMESGETIKEAVIREYYEETSLRLQSPALAGVFTFLVGSEEWMMFTFMCHEYEGNLTNHCEEGQLEWVSIHDLDQLPMAEGDRKIFSYILEKKGLVTGAFTYTEEFELLDFRMER